MTFLRCLASVFLLATVSLGGTSAEMNCTHEMDLVFLVDASGSICSDKSVKTCDNWRACLAFIHAIVNDMIIGENDVRVALTIFETTPFPQWKLSDYYDKSALLNAIDNLKYPGGTTNTIAALESLSTTFSPENGDRPDVRDTVILLTDGRPRINNNFFPLDEIRAAVKKVTDRNIRLMAVGITDDIDMATLHELSSTPQMMQENVFVAKDYQSLQTIQKKLEKQNCINVTHLCLDADMDITFLIDASGSICDTDPSFDYSIHETCNNWSLMLQFLHKIINVIFRGSNTRVGLVTFRSKAQVVFNLTRYTDKSELLSAVDNLKYEKGGETDMTDALHLARTEVFNTAGDRPSSPNAVVMITDGFPTQPSTLQAEIDAIRSSNIHLLALGVTNKVDEITLRKLSAPPHQINVTYFMAMHYIDIESFRIVLEEKICEPSN